MIGSFIIISHAEFFGETSNHPGDSAPVQPRFGTLGLLAFPKTKITWKGRDFRPLMRFWKIWGAAVDDWENCVRSQGAYFEGNWGIIVLCTMFLVSCIFFSKCLYFSHYMAGDLLDITCMCLRIYTSILWLIYTSLMVSSDEQKFLIFMKSSLSIFYFIICIIGVFPKDTKILP